MLEVADTAYLNRCLQGLYTPGSVFKIVTLASALDYDPGVLNQIFTCSGTWEYEGGSIVCMSGRTAHGNVTLEQAFTKSCNVTFGKLAYYVQGLKTLPQFKALDMVIKADGEEIHEKAFLFLIRFLERGFPLAYSKF